MAGNLTLLRTPSAAATPAPAVAGAGVNATWIYTLGCIVFFFVALNAMLVVDLAERFAGTRSLGDLAVMLSVCVAAAVQLRYCWFLRESNPPARGWTIALAAPAVLAWGLAFAVPASAPIAVIPAWLSASLILVFTPAPRRWYWLALAAALAVVPIIVVGVPRETWFNAGDGARNGVVIFYAITLPFVVLMSLWWWRVVVRLDEGRHVAAELAVTRERLRFAADLHDIQGHHLQVIALKAELASRLLDHDPAATTIQVDEIRIIAKQALEETRSLVAGLREVALEDELENAREVLALAGADCTLVVEAAGLEAHAQLQRVVALTVREGTTNILRHSAATLATITLRTEAGAHLLELTNNGVVAPSTPGRSGSGLASLRNRIEELGGTLSTVHDPDHFCLRVRVPISEEHTA